MDLADLDPRPLANAGVEMKIKHPTTQAPITNANGEEMSIKVIGGDSDKVAKIKNAMVDRFVQQGKLTKTAAKQDEERIDFCVQCTLGWSGILYNGQPLEFTAANAKTLYTNLGWLREQVDIFIGQRENFLKPLSPA